MLGASNKITMGFSLGNVRIYWVTTAHKQVLDLTADYNLFFCFLLGGAFKIINRRHSQRNKIFALRFEMSARA